MTVFLYVAMILGGIAAAVGMSNQKKGKVWGRPVSIIGAVVAVIAAVACSYISLNGGSSEMQNNMYKFAYSRGYRVAKWLGEEHSGATVLVVARPNSAKDGNVDALVEWGKKSGLEIIAPTMDDLKLICGNSTEFFTVKNFGRIAKEYKSAKIIVAISPVGFPISVPDLQTAKNLKGKKLVVMDPAGSGFENYLKGKTDKQLGEVIGIVTTRLGANIEATPGRDNDKNFDFLYSLIRRSNLDADMQNYRAN